MPQPTLEESEEISSAINANHTQGGRAVGGRLFVTNLNLRFVANRFDRFTGGRDSVLPRAEVRSVEVAARSMKGGPFSGGLRRRLHVVAKGGGELFVVNFTDEDILNSLVIGPSFTGGQVLGQYQPPRLYGVKLGIRTLGDLLPDNLW